MNIFRTLYDSYKMTKEYNKKLKSENGLDKELKDELDKLRLIDELESKLSTYYDTKDEDDEVEFIATSENDLRIITDYLVSQDIKFNIRDLRILFI